LRELDWVPVAVEEQRIRSEARRGFQKHLLAFPARGQMETLAEWTWNWSWVNSPTRVAPISSILASTAGFASKWLGPFG